MYWEIALSNDVRVMQILQALSLLCTMSLIKTHACDPQLVACAHVVSMCAGSCLILFVWCFSDSRVLLTCSSLSNVNNAVNNGQCMQGMRLPNWLGALWQATPLKLLICDMYTQDGKTTF